MKQLLSLLVVVDVVLIFVVVVRIKIILRSPCGVVNELHGNIVVSEFEPKSSYYVHFRINILGKAINPLISPS